MKNNSHSPVTEMLSGKNKIWLMIGLALISIADLSACIALWAFGAEAGYWFVTFMMTVVDVLYLLGVALSNQRFKYARLLFIVYIAVSALFILIWLCETLLQNEVTFDNVTVVIWSLLHAVGIVAAVITYIYAARCLRGGRAIQLGLAVAFSAMALVLVVYYGISIGHDGYFGQGGDTLPLVYEYIGDNECEVTGIVYGKGDRVVVPYEFNGRKVTKVSANVFTYANVKSVTLNCDSDVALCDDISKVSSVNRDITIYVDKKYVDVVKGKLYGTIRENDYYWHSKLELGNNVSPINLDKDEVYITFDYDSDSYKRADATVIPTWYGKKGETFKLSDVDGIDYAQHADAKDDDDLFYCYDNGGYIMSELKGNGAAINGATITQSFSGVPVRFQRVYKVFAGESNDKMYKTANHFEFSTVGGEQCDYK
ncbi:MAG: hypothetical protein K2L88_05455, partial [Clostridiales bacterium]|nr:hypothetical protein [Clostridiales bacterium]